MEKSLIRIHDEILFAMQKANLISMQDREFLHNSLLKRMDDFEEKKEELSQS
jgi:hypothetical protein